MTGLSRFGRVNKWTLPKLGEINVPMFGYPGAASLPLADVSGLLNGDVSYSAGQPPMMQFPEGPRYVSAATWNGLARSGGGRCELASLTMTLLDSGGPGGVRQVTLGAAGNVTSAARKSAGTTGQSYQKASPWAVPGFYQRLDRGQSQSPSATVYAYNVVKLAPQSGPLAHTAVLFDISEANQSALFSTQLGNGYRSGVFAGEGARAVPLASTTWPTGANGAPGCQPYLGAVALDPLMALHSPRPIVVPAFDDVAAMLQDGSGAGSPYQPTNSPMLDPDFRNLWCLGTCNTYPGTIKYPGQDSVSGGLDNMNDMGRPYMVDVKLGGRYAPRQRSTRIGSLADGTLAGNLGTNGLGMAGPLGDHAMQLTQLFLSDPQDDLAWRTGTAQTAPTASAATGYYPKGSGPGARPVFLPYGTSAPSGAITFSGFYGAGYNSFAMWTPFGPAWCVPDAGSGSGVFTWTVLLILRSPEQGYPLGYIRLNVTAGDATALKALGQGGSMPVTFGPDTAGVWWLVAQYQGTQYVAYSKGPVSLYANQSPNLAIYGATCHECSPEVLGLAV